MLTLYGIPNCDSCRKARKWLDGAGVAYRFHDVRVDGVSEDLLDRWLTLTDWKTLLNT
ncbi:MAG: glutaredoxin domain-containing protein, partial [Woeseiaceae bacterium]